MEHASFVWGRRDEVHETQHDCDVFLGVWTSPFTGACPSRLACTLQQYSSTQVVAAISETREWEHSTPGSA